MLFTSPPLSAATAAPPRVGGRLPLPGLAWGLLLALVLAWLASWAWPITDEDPAGPALDSPAALRSALSVAGSDPAHRRVLVMGDSVVAGTLLERRLGAGWERHRLVPLMNQAIPASASVSIHELSSPGMLPADLLLLVEQLQELDPDGELELLVELNLRYFSQAYAAEPDTHALPFLLDGGGGGGAPSWEDLHRTRGGFGGLRARLVRAWSRAFPELNGAGDLDPELAPALYQLRVRPHYLQLELGPDSAQVQALRDLVALLRAEGRQATFFLTPLDESFLVPAGSEQQLYDAAVQVGRLLDDDALVRLVDLNTRALGPGDFLDHCHPTADGNRLLAGQLLELLGVPSSVALPAGRRHAPPQQDQTWVLGGLSSGDQDGSGAQVRFQDPADLAFIEPGVLVVADSGNQVLKRLLPDRRTSSWWAGTPGQAGHRDGAPGQALFSSPSHLAADGEGGVFVIDAGSHTLRHVDSVGSVSSLPPYHQPVQRAEPLLWDLAVWQGEAWVLDHEQEVLRAVPRGGGQPRVVARFGLAVPISLALDRSGDLWLLLREGELLHLERERLEGGEPPVLSDLMHTSLSQRGEDPGYYPGEEYPPGHLPLLAPTGLVAAPDSDEILVLDDRWGQPFSWVIRTDDHLGFTFNPPAADGVVDRPLQARGAAAFQPGSGDLFWLATDRSLLVRWARRLRVPRWDLGEGGPDLRAAVQDDSFRVAAFGTSLAGSRADVAPAPSTESLPGWLQDRLRLHPRTAGRPLDVLNLCSAGQSLVHGLTSFSQQPAGSVQAAIFFLDRHSMRDLGAQDLTTRWSDDGLPVPMNSAHRNPWPLQDLPLAAVQDRGDPTGRRHLHRMLAAIQRHAAQQGVRVYLVDLLRVDDYSGWGLALGDEQIEAQVSMLAEEASALGLPLLEPWPWVLQNLPAGHPLTQGPGEHHFYRAAYDLIADHLVERLAPELDQAISARQARAPVAPAPDAALRPAVARPSAELLGSAQALEPWRISRWRDGERSGLVVDVTDLDAAVDSWRRALWAAASGGGRQEPLEIAVVRYRSRDEYGQQAWQSIEFLARFRIEAEQRSALVEQASALLEDPAAPRPDWLAPLCEGDCD